MGKTHVTENDFTDLEKVVSSMVEAAEKKRAREFYESDLNFTGDAGHFLEIPFWRAAWRRW